MKSLDDNLQSAFNFIKSDMIHFIDELAKKLQNIRETSLDRTDAINRIEELAKTTGISKSTLHRLYDRT